MQISLVMLLFSDQISGRGKVFGGGGANCLRGHPPVEKSQCRIFGMMLFFALSKN